MGAEEHRAHKPVPEQAGRCAGARGLAAPMLFAGLAFVLALSGFALHVNLATAGLLELFLVCLAALRSGFLAATAASMIAVLCLDFLFTEPLFRFTISDPQNWIFMVTFEITALLVSSVSSQARRHAVQAEEQQRRAVRL